MRFLVPITSSSLVLTLLCALQAQTPVPSKPASQPKPEKTVEAIVNVDAYDWMDIWGFDAFGRQFNTLVARVEKVEDGVVLDPWIRVDYYGSNRHHKEDRLPDEIFEPGHRWRMRLTPTRISERNYTYCRPQAAGTVEVPDGSGKLVEVSTIRGVSKDVQDVPDVDRLKCYALRREDLHEVTDSE